jgi:hypothetical protein
MPNNTRKIAFIAAFVALAVGGGFAEQIPNVEIVTMTVFLAGALLGPAPGLVAGISTAYLFSVLNPLGATPNSILIARIIAWGLCGAVAGLLPIRYEVSIASRIFLGACGLLLTVVYQFLIAASYAISTNLDWNAIIASLALSAWFSGLHVLSNTLIFAIILPILIRRLLALPVFQTRIATTRSLTGK